MDDDAILDLFRPLYDDIGDEDQFSITKPLLAHYTSMEALENILRSNEVWFSNPLFMNDLDEVRFGLWHGPIAIKSNESVRLALKTAHRNRLFLSALDHYIADFEENYLLDTYVFCMSEHDMWNKDGLLSMWRGYGANGKGAALVFDMSTIHSVESPITVSRVRYGSTDERLQWFDRIGTQFAGILADNDIPDDKLYLVSHAILERLKLGALFMKHDGFKEEREWRAVYRSDEDREGKLRPMQHYLNGPRGVEPKLKFKFEPRPGVTPDLFSLDLILAAILLGPSTSTRLAVRSIERMLDLIERPELKCKLLASSIPLRPT